MLVAVVMVMVVPFFQVFENVQLVNFVHVQVMVVQDWHGYGGMIWDFHNPHPHRCWNSYDYD